MSLPSEAVGEAMCQGPCFRGQRLQGEPLGSGHFRGAPQTSESSECTAFHASPPKLAAGESAPLVLWARCVQQPPRLQETAIVSPWSGQHGVSVGGKDGGRPGWTGGWKDETCTCTGREEEGWPTNHGAHGGRGGGDAPRWPWALTPASAPTHVSARSTPGRPRWRLPAAEEGSEVGVVTALLSATSLRGGGARPSVSTHRAETTGRQGSARPPEVRRACRQGGEAGTARGGPTQAGGSETAGGWGGPAQDPAMRTQTPAPGPSSPGFRGSH